MGRGGGGAVCCFIVMGSCGDGTILAQAGNSFVVVMCSSVLGGVVPCGTGFVVGTARRWWEGEDLT